MNEIELQNIESSVGEGDPIVTRDNAVLNTVKVDLSAQIGSTTISVEELYNLKKGDMLSLTEKLNEPVKLLLDNQVIAHGKLCVVDDNFAVEITNI